MKANGNIIQNVLPVEEATIQERQVTVQVLTIGTKQVTQSLYRQLIEEPAITAEGKLRGPIWGWVNLHVDCDSKKDHVHVVWEHNGQLKRSFMLTSYKTTAHYRQSENELFTLADAYLGLVGIANKKFNSNQDGKIWLTVKGRKVSPRISNNIRRLWEQPERLRQLQTRLEDEKNDVLKERTKTEIESFQGYIDRIKSEIMEDVKRDIDSTKRDTGAQLTYTWVYEQMEEIALKMTSTENQWEESRQTVEKAGQLFIAVSGVWK